MFREMKFALVFLLLGIGVLLTPISFSFTGEVISENSVGNFSFLSILGIVFLMVSFLLFISRKSLDAIVIPTGGGGYDEEDKIYSADRERAGKAMDNIDKLEEGKYFLISGYKGRSKKEIFEGQPYSIYKFLRRHGIKPSQMLVEGSSHDTMENVLYTLKKLKNRKEKKNPWDVAFVSYPGHLKRFEDFAKQAIKKGIISEKDFNFYKIQTGEDPIKDIKYESNLLRKIRHKIKLFSMGKYKVK